MTRVMIDLETMGLNSNAAITAIGAVVIDPEPDGSQKKFYTEICLVDNQINGRHIDANTILWWMRQEDSAREHLNSFKRIKFKEAIEGFDKFLTLEVGATELWANGTSFDNAILADAYRQLGLSWEFWKDRCYRTLKEMYPGVKKESFEGTKHNALDDAKMQAKHLLAIEHQIDENTSQY